MGNPLIRPPCATAASCRECLGASVGCPRDSDPRRAVPAPKRAPAFPMSAQAMPTYRALGRCSVCCSKPSSHTHRRDAPVVLLRCTRVGRTCQITQAGHWPQGPQRLVAAGRLVRARAVTDDDQGPCTRAGCGRSRCRRPLRGRRSYATPRRTGDSPAGCRRRSDRGWAFLPEREMGGRVGSVGVALPPPPTALGVPADGVEILSCRPR